jgi:parallel beta-helix repeat protein
MTVATSVHHRGRRRAGPRAHGPLLAMLTALALLVPSARAQEADAGRDAGATDLVTSVEELIGRAWQGGTVRLAAGAFELPHLLALTESVTIVGAGADRTVIRSDAEWAVIEFSGSGTLALRGLAVEHTGTAYADVVNVESGTADLRDVAIRGGRLHPERASHGAGIRFAGVATGTIRDALVHGNEADGIVIEGRATPTIESVTMRDNGWNGLRYTDAAGGAARTNTLSGNGRNGVLVAGTAAPTLRGNTASDNTFSGFAYTGEARGTATANASRANAFHGISLEGEAAPRLEGNVLADNGASGIAYFDAAHGTASGNTVEANAFHGIGVEDEAHPTLQGNTVRRNGHSGVAYFHRGHGTARGNLIEHNERNGIQVSDEALPMLLGNSVLDNGWSGVAYFGAAGGTARDNVIERNANQGIYCGDQATARLEENLLRDNAEYGIGSHTTAACLVGTNRYAGNERGNTGRWAP